jgi:hypothetical protein
MEKLL